MKDMDASIKFLDEYGLSKEDFTETLATDFVFSTGKKYADVMESKTKAAFTRKYIYKLKYHIFCNKNH